MKQTKTIQDTADKSWKMPTRSKAAEAVSTFSPTEKALFLIFVVLFLASAVSLLWKVNNSFLVTVPEKGGTLTEGVVGSPRFLNPVLAISDADRDLTTLVYSGLLKATPEGKLVPDLAQSYTVSADGLTYTFLLRDDIYFHDGTKVTADDVEFTVKKAQDPNLKSPKRVNWEGVAVEKISDREISFMLKEPYASFIENATLGILPRHIWENITSEEFPFSNFNVEPVGSGPYRIKGLKRDSGGIPIYYQLKPFSRYAAGEPYIENLIIKFYDNHKELMQAVQDESIESVHSVTPVEAEILRNVAQVETAHLPRIFGIFFNQSQASIFTSADVRKALNISLDKEKIAGEILKGYGTVIDSPLPPGSAAYAATTATSSMDEARALLEEDGWVRDPVTGIFEKEGESEAETVTLSFSLSTSDAPDLKRTAELVAENWRELGADVEVHVFELGELNQNVIRPRKYDALLFGQVVGRVTDPYPFWHSSERNDPGLNVAQYASITSDKLLEEARRAQDEETRKAKLREFVGQIKGDVPAIFLYSPDFLYVLPRTIHGAQFGNVVFPADRFLGINTWYIETNKVWSVFANN